MRHATRILAVQLFSLIAAVFSPQILQTWGVPPGNVAADDETQAYQRFLTTLQKRPRFGVSLERVFQHHRTKGTSDEFAAGLRESADSRPDDGSRWQLLGLFELRRGRADSAIAALQQAERLLPNDPLVAWQLGEALLLGGQTDSGIAALERAMERQPEQSDRLEISFALGRTYQLAGHPQQALAVWRQLAQAFPDDVRVMDEIAGRLAQLGHTGTALQHYEVLAKRSQDPIRRVEYLLIAAGLKVRLGRDQEAVRDYEIQLEQIQPDSWLFRDIRRRIDEILQRRSDDSEVINYYRHWLENHPDDVDAAVHLASHLNAAGRDSEARLRLAEMVRRAPTDRRLRNALILQLVRMQDYPAALDQYEQLHQRTPADVDQLEDWGRLCLHDTRFSPAERKQRAARVWQLLLAYRESDPVTVRRVALLLRSADMPHEAILKYQQAIRLASDTGELREELGEYLYSLGRDEEAISTWMTMAADDSRTPSALTRLAVILHQHGFRERALATVRESCVMELDFDQRLQMAQILQDAGLAAEATEQLNRITPESLSPEQHQRVRELRTNILLHSGQLQNEIRRIAAELSNDQTPNPAEWLTLADYQAAAGLTADAIASLDQALRPEPRSVELLARLAELHEAMGDLAAAAGVYRRLANEDPSTRSRALQQIVRLELSQWHRDAAMEVGRMQIADAPTDPAQVRQFASLCFYAGEVTEGLNALRTAIAANPADFELALSLSQVLADQFLTSEAIEVGWECFDRAREPADRDLVIRHLTGLCQRRGQFAQLVSQLEIRSRRPDQRQSLLRCLSAAWATAGDPAMARDTLVASLDNDNPDPDVLTQLVGLAERAGDLPDAVSYQRRLVAVQPSPEARQRLIGLRLRSGEIDEAESVTLRLEASRAKPPEWLRRIDREIEAGNRPLAWRLSLAMQQRYPESWEVCIRLAGIAMRDGLEREAAAWLTRLDSFALPDSVRACDSFSRPEQSDAAGETAPRRMPEPADDPCAAGAADHVCQEMVIAATFIAFARSTEVWHGSVAHHRIVWNAAGSGRSWPPATLGQARLAGKLLKQLAGVSSGSKSLPSDALYDRLRTDAKPDLQLAWQGFLLDMYSQAEPARLTRWKDVARRIESPSASLLFIQSLLIPCRPAIQPDFSGCILCRPRFVMSSAGRASTPDEQDVDALLQAVQSLLTTRPEWLLHATFRERLPICQCLVTFGRSTEVRQLVRTEMLRQYDRSGLVMALQLAAATDDSEAIPEIMQLRRQMKGASSEARSMSDAERDYEAEVLTAVVDLLEYRREYSLLPEIVEEGVLQTAAARIAALDGQAGVWFLQEQTAPEWALLSRVFHCYRDSGRLTEFLDWLELRVKGATELQRRVMLTLLGQVVPSETCDWSTSSLLILIRLAEKFSDDGQLRLAIAQEAREDYPHECLLLLNSIDSEDEFIQRERDELIVRTAADLQDPSLGQDAADRLAARRQDSSQREAPELPPRASGLSGWPTRLAAAALPEPAAELQKLDQLLTTSVAGEQADLQAEIAMQIVLSTESQSSGPGRSDELLRIRREALRRLTELSQIDSLIREAEQRLERNPQSRRILEQLVDYCTAAGQTERAAQCRRELTRLPAPKTADPARLASDLERAEQGSDACDHLLILLQQDPVSFAADFETYLQTFETAGREADLAEQILKQDLRPFRPYSSILIRMASALADGESPNRALTIIDRVIHELPNQAVEHLLLIRELGLLDDLTRTARLSEVICAFAADASPWRLWSDLQGLDQLHRLLAGPDHVNALLADLASTLDRHPGWHGGRLLVALLYAGMEDHESFDFQMAELLERSGQRLPAEAALTAVDMIPDSAEARHGQRGRVLDAVVLADSREAVDSWNDPSKAFARLLEAWTRTRTPWKARRLILQRHADITRVMDRPQGTRAERTLVASGIQWLAELLLKHGEPLEAEWVRRHARAWLADLPQFKSEDSVEVIRWDSLDAHLQPDREFWRKSIEDRHLARWLAERGKAPPEGSLIPPGDLMLQISPELSAWSFDPRELSRLRCRSAVLDAFRAFSERPRTTPDSVAGLCAEIAAADDVDVRLLMAAAVYAQGSRDLALQDNVIRRINESLARTAEIAVRPPPSPPSPVILIHQYEMPWETGFCVLAGLLADDPLSRPLVEPLIDRGLAAVREGADLHPLVRLAALQSCAEAAETAGNRPLAVALLSEAADVMTRLQPRTPEPEAERTPVDIGHEIRSRLLPQVP